MDAARSDEELDVQMADVDLGVLDGPGAPWRHAADEPGEEAVTNEDGDEPEDEGDDKDEEDDEDSDEEDSDDDDEDEDDVAEVESGTDR